jgi:hypothetical protein
MTVFHSYELRYYFKKYVFHSSYYFGLTAKNYPSSFSNCTMITKGGIDLLSGVYFGSQDVRGFGHLEFKS